MSRIEPKSAARVRKPHKNLLRSGSHRLPRIPSAEPSELASSSGGFARDLLVGALATLVIWTQVLIWPGAISTQLALVALIGAPLLAACGVLGLRGAFAEAAPSAA